MPDQLLTPAQAARLLGVTPRHARRLLDAIRTPGGHRRYRPHEVVALARERGPQPDRRRRR